MAVASQFITLTNEYQLLPANAINLIVVDLTGTAELICSGDGISANGQQTIASLSTSTDTQITENILHYVKLSADETAKLYFGVS